MKAFVVEKYGKDGLRAAELPVPALGAKDVLVEIRAASINPLDKMVPERGVQTTPEVQDSLRARA